MKTLHQNELHQVSGGEPAFLAAAFTLGFCTHAVWTYMTMPSEYYVLEQKYVETTVQNPLYDANGLLAAYDVITYGEYQPTYVKAS